MTRCWSTRQKRAADLVAACRCALLALSRSAAERLGECRGRAYGPRGGLPVDLTVAAKIPPFSETRAPTTRHSLGETPSCGL